jgi:V8-like Glu-specific endopeptidase
VWAGALCLIVSGGLSSTSCDDEGSSNSNENKKEAVCGDGICSPSETAEACPQDCETCDGVSFQGCCDGTTLYWCEGETLRVEACGSDECGWSGSTEQGYDCGYQGEDPQGVYARTCGCEVDKADISTRIYHGTEAPESACLTDGQILAIGALMADFGDGLENFCTATLVASDVVLTAAHCLTDDWGGVMDAEDIWFAVGVDALDPVYLFESWSLTIHEEYDGMAADQDLGIVVLVENALDVLPSIEPVVMNRDSMTDDYLGKVVQNVGYGVTHDDWYNSLRWWTTEPIVQIAEQEFVVYGNGWSSVCGGDSGGPALYSSGTLAPQILGTVSWGDASCVDYDHYCRVDANTTFLDDFVGTWDECRGLDFTGRCVGNIAQWCENGELHQHCCTETCGEDTSGNYRCSDPPSLCDGVDALGTCRGDQLVWCDEGVIRHRHCNVCDGEKCGWVGGQVGYGCIVE